MIRGSTIRRPAQLGCIAVAVFLSACAGLTTSTPRYTVEEVSSSETDSQQAVLAMPTRFRIDYAVEKTTWDRAQFFFVNYTRGKGSREFEDDYGEVYLSSMADHRDRFIYQISKKAGGPGVTYSVTCEPRTENAEELQHCNQNARNIARFLRDGELELSLLVR